MCSSLNQWQAPWKGLVPALRPLTRTVLRVLKNIPVLLLLVAGLALPLAGALVTFGGASILAQQLCYLQKCGVKAAPFILFKAAQAALCFALLLPYSL